MMLSNEGKERGIMKNRKSKLTVLCMTLFVALVQSVAALGAGAASFFGAHQPRVPEKLRK